MSAKLISRCGYLVFAAALPVALSETAAGQEADPFAERPARARKEAVANEADPAPQDPFAERPATANEGSPGIREAATSDDPFADVAQAAATNSPCDKYKPLAVDSPQGTAAREAINRALDSSMSLEFVDVPMSEVFLFIEDEKKIQIVIDDRAFDDLGLSSDTPITIELRDVTLRAGLEHMLRAFDLKFLIWREALLITSVDASLDGHYQTVKVYPVADLLRKADSGTLEYDVLVDTITAVIEPDSWVDVGGIGTIRAVAGTLVIAQPDSTHAQIESLLCILRRVGEPELSPRSASIKGGFPVGSRASKAPNRRGAGFF